MVRFSNLELLRILRENARTPFLRIAKQLGVTETAVRKRVRRLEEEGIIVRYTVEVDFKKLGYEVHAFIGIDTKPETLIDTIKSLKGLEEVVSLYSTSGDHMLIAECLFKSSSDLVKFIDKLNSMSGVTRVCPAIVIEKIK
ncbi:MAG: Lrp/AsnC family transcriptional regulator [Candidatus Nezhaarchaeota archaeon]|nr:Lrp/AsnC family transcriptional regulator [Candidatus Nezhaarchaeota archaeon]